jgi:GDP-L-fucose synthase
MDTESRIFVAGHRGLVGSAILRKLQALGYTGLLTRTRAELDLTDQSAVRQFFAAEKVEYLFLAAARVGGILANSRYPADFIYENLTIQNNVIHNAYLAGTKRLLFLGSSCIYPKLAPQPMRENYLLTGSLEPTNEPYAIAKIAGIKMCESYNRQYGTSFFSVMPTNLYGPNDNFDLEKSHVIPALIRKFHEAKEAGAGEVVIWGTGKPRREFLHVDDMAAACIFIMNLAQEDAAAVFNRHPEPCFVNVGSGKDIPVAELAELVGSIVGYRGEIRYDPSKPDGTPRKLLDVSRLHGLGWRARIGLREGVADTYRWYRQHLENSTGAAKQISSQKTTSIQGQ